MSILKKVKELGAEIVKTVDESGIKDNVKCATIIIKDTVEKGKNDFEAKIEESKRKVEEEKKRLTSLSIDKEEKINNSLQTELYFIDLEKAEKLANDFNEKICCISSISKDTKLAFGNGCEEKNITKILSNWNKVDDNTEDLIFDEERPVVTDEAVLKVVDSSINNEPSEYDSTEKERVILCYNGGKKGSLLLSNENFYLNLKHPLEELLYLVKIPTENINNIEVIKENDKNILTINNVQVGIIDVNIVALLEKYFDKLREKNYEVLITDIIEEVKKVRFVESQVVIQIINDLIEKEKN